MEFTKYLPKRPLYEDNNTPLDTIKVGQYYLMGYESSNRRGMQYYMEAFVQIQGAYKGDIAHSGKDYIRVKILWESTRINHSYMNDGAEYEWKPWNYNEHIMEIYIRDIHKYRDIIPGRVAYSSIPTLRGGPDYPLVAFYRLPLSKKEVEDLLGNYGIPTDPASIVAQFYGSPNAKKGGDRRKTRRGRRAKVTSRLNRRTRRKQ